MDLDAINKIIIESRKREQLVSEADNIISEYDTIVQIKKQEIQSIDLERNELIKNIQYISKTGDIKILQKMIERL